MKQLNLNTKQYKYWVNSMAALSLSIALQAQTCASGGYGGHNYMYMANKRTDEQFRQGHATSHYQGLGYEKIKNISSSPKELDLHAAVSAGKPERIKDVLQRITKAYSEGISFQGPNAIDHKGYTAFGKTIKKGLHEVIKYFMECKQIDPTNIGTSPQEKGLNALLLALKNKHGDKTAAILLKDDQIKQYIATKDEEGNSPIHLALQPQLKSNEPLKLMVDTLTSLSDLNVKDARGRTPLYLAAKRHQKDNFKILFERIQKLASSKDDIAKSLFETDKEGYTIFERAYASSTMMFDFILMTVRDELATADWDSIYQGIKIYYNTHKHLADKLAGKYDKLKHLADKLALTNVVIFNKLQTIHPVSHSTNS